MNKSFFIKVVSVVICAALFSLAVCEADLVMVQEISGAGEVDGKESRITTTFKGDMARVDVGDKISTIMDGKSGKMTNLMHKQKMVMTMDSGDVQAMQQQILQAMGKDASTEAETVQPELKPTGKKETINGFDAQEYIVEQNGMTSYLWLASNFPNKERILAQMAKFQNSEAFKFAAAAKSYDVAKLPGIPVRVVSAVEGLETTVTLVSLEEKDVDASLFEIPAGYNTLKVPSMGDLLKKVPAGE